MLIVSTVSKLTRLFRNTMCDLDDIYHYTPQNISIMLLLRCPVQRPSSEGRETSSI